MTLARGEYLIVMDDDDISLPNRLEEQIKFMDSHPDVTMAGSWCELFSSKPDKGIINYLKYCFIISAGYGRKKLSRLGRNVLLQPYYAHDLRFAAPTH